MPEAVRVPDLAERARSLDTAHSFIVQAPAGSGKTELLIQRFLALLGGVERPEEIAAITFTIKAAAEMRGRVLAALRSARNDARPEAAHDALTWDLARAALARNDALGWNLEESATRLRVQTIDALCASLTRQMPVLSRFGAQPESVEDASAMYAEAARNLLKAVEHADDAARVDLERLLSHLDNNAGAVERLLAMMLEKRDHWVRFLGRAHDRAALEAALEEMRAAAVARVRGLWPAGLAAPRAGDIEGWRGHAGAMLTKDGKWRAATPQALKDDATLLQALCEVQALPDAAYDDRQWDALDAIVRLAPRAIAELQVVFALRRQADFVEISQGALRALGTADAPTDLMLALDYRIRHILVDEFQDTSSTQFDLLERLTSGWEPGDGRTLFLVGDPMQSIYRFREAEVGRFLQAWREGIGSVSLEPVLLNANFRSQAGLVDWVNRCFEAVMPVEDDIHSGAVRYARSESVHAAENEPVVVHPFYNGDRAGEGRRVAEVARRALARPSGEDGKPMTVAILVRSRTHLLEVLPRLREADLAFRAIEIEALGHRPVVQDLLALTRALSHLADRTAWLAVLRAPWCGLSLADLHALAAPSETETVWELMIDAARVAPLSPDGRERLERLRGVLGRALTNRRRGSLRGAVEGAWLALGGPACAGGDTEIEDADIYLDHLERSEEGGALADLAAFEESVGKLFALPDLEAPESLQVMTIHKAKGLEFDTVIVPGLDSATGSDDKELFTWMETPGGRLLLAPIDATGSGRDETYKFIRALAKKKDDHERARLLYVAATRARKQLHLLGCASVDDHGAVKEPPRGSLLRKLWPVVAGGFPEPDAVSAKPAGGTGVPVTRQGELRRLVRAPVIEAPPPVAWRAPVDEPTYGEIEFSWASDTARRVGSVVHRWLQRIAEDDASGWNATRVARERSAIAKALAACNVAPAHIEGASERVIAALVASLEDKRGRWLLGPQRNARNEYRLSTLIGGVRHSLVIDRMFDDSEGRTWIVDYKTSSHLGSDLQGFLASEEERYREQLERYAIAIARPQARRALYFPLLKGWREWGAKELPARGKTGDLFPLD